MSHPKRCVVALLAVATVMAGSAPAFAQSATPTVLAPIGNLEGELVPGELLVGFGPSSSPAQVEAALDRSDVAIADDISGTNTKLVKVADGNLASAMDDLRRQPG